MKTLTLATFNVRGLTKPRKQHQLIRDVTRHRIDVCAIQETKVEQLSDTYLNNHKVIFFETKSPHYGNGFILSPQLKNNGIGMCQIELVFYKSSYPTPKSAHTTSKKHLQN